jgi:hypothetical protein
MGEIEGGGSINLSSVAINCHGCIRRPKAEGNKANKLPSHIVVEQPRVRRATSEQSASVVAKCSYCLFFDEKSLTVSATW